MRLTCCLPALLLAASALPAQSWLDCKLAPGWEPAGAVRQYTADNLYDYKDGGAEGYLSYGFLHMTSLDCKSGGDTLTIDLSEMADADAAYGIFAANLDSRLPVSKIGMGSQMQPLSATFARGKYFVEFVVVAATQEADRHAMLETLAGRINEHLEGRATPPEALSWFPAENQTSLRMAPESVLGLRLLKRGYIAKYKQGQAFLVPEATPGSAADVMKKLRERFAGSAPAQIGDEAFQIKAQYLGGLCIFRKGRILAGYANLPEAADAAALAAQLAARIPAEAQK